MATAATCRTPGAPEPWVRQIARREALRLVVRLPDERSRCALEDADSAEVVAPEALLERLDARRALAQLSDEERRLVGLRYVADLTQSQVARRLGIPEGTAKVRLHRVRRRLRAELGAA